MSEDDTKNNKSFVNGLKTEWSLFWDTLVGDDQESQQDQERRERSGLDPFQTGKLEQFSLEKIKSVTRALSVDRNKLNQKLESLNKELDLNSVKLESLRLVGGEQEETLARIHQLTDLGQVVSQQLDMINEKLKLMREVEDQIRENEL